MTNIETGLNFNWPNFEIFGIQSQNLRSNPFLVTKSFGHRGPGVVVAYSYCNINVCSVTLSNIFTELNRFRKRGRMATRTQLVWRPQWGLVLAAWIFASSFFFTKSSVGCILITLQVINVFNLILLIIYQGIIHCLDIHLNV